MNLYSISLACTCRLLLLVMLCSLTGSAQTWSPDSIQAAYDRAFELSSAHKFGQAEKLINEGLQQSLQTGDSGLITKGYADLAELFFFMKDLNAAEKNARLGESYCKPVTDTIACMKVAGVLGNILSLKEGHAEAVASYKKSLRLCELAGRQDYYHDILFNMTTTFGEVGRYTDALDALIKCQEYYQAKGEKDKVGTIHNNIGLLYHEHFNESGNAMNHFRKAIAISRELPEKWNLARDYNNISLVFMTNGSYDSARYYLNQAIEIRKGYGDKGGLAILYNAKGDLQLRTGEFSSAYRYYKKAYDIATQFGIPEGQYHTNLGLGRASDSMGNTAEAESFYRQAFHFAQQTGSFDYLRSSTKHLYRHYKFTGNSDSALSALEQSRQYQDTLNARKQEEKLLNLKTRYETEMTETENALLRTQKDQQAAIMQKDENLRQIFYILFVVFALILIILIYAYRLSNRQKKALQRMNAKLSSQSRELNRINSAKDRLFSVISHDLRTPLASLDTCLEMIANHDMSEEEKEELLRDLQKETTNTLQTLDDLLDWAKMQQQGDVTTKTEFDLNPLLEEVLNLYRPVARQKNIDLLFEKGTGTALVNADLNQIRIVVRNLLSNAIKFTPNESTVMLNLTQTGDQISVSVTDQGKGISKENLDKIQDPNNYYTSRGTAGEIGSGVGLSLSFEFIEKHGSTLVLEQAEPHGTRASFALQRVPTSAEKQTA